MIAQTICVRTIDSPRANLMCVKVLRFCMMAAWLVGCGSILGIDGDYAVAVPGEVRPDGSVRLDSAVPSTKLDGSTTGTDGVAPVGDANMPVVDTGPPCLGYICNGTCLAMASDCLSCAGATLACPNGRTCVSRCDNCPGATLDCTTCTGTTVTASVCESRGSASCVNNPGYSHCGCTVTSECPSPSQVCVQGICSTCGESGTDNLLCKRGFGNECRSSDRECK
jgi:hypothetical protein